MAERQGWKQPILLIAILLVAGVAAWRWHSASVVAPDPISLQAEGPAIILALRSDDCPDRQAAVDRWVERRRASDPSGSLPIVIAVLQGGPAVASMRFPGFPSLERDAVRAVERALLRAELPGTPALLLVDQEGNPVFAESFSLSGLGDRVVLAGALLSEGTPIPGSPDPGMTRK